VYAHRAANQQRVAFAEQLFDDVDLVGDFCAAKDSHEGPRGFADGLRRDISIPFESVAR